MEAVRRALKNITNQVAMRIVTTVGKTWVLTTRHLVTNTLKNPKENQLKRLLFIGALLISIGSHAQVTSWDNSPLNYNNSPLNYNNSSLNYNNSPLNYQNSPLNYNSTNGVYDNNGNRIGYETQSPSGVTNVFDNNGNRIGYSPSKRQWIHTNMN